MRLPIPCMQCSFEEGKAPSIGPISTVEFHDDGRYEATCPKGHTSVVILQQQKFELLFDIGAYAIADGYYREAVSSFTSSLERFYEFFIKAVLFELGIADTVISSSWKSVSRQSERQLGAFIFLYTTEFGRQPTILTGPQVEFRNDVIHRGTIPSRKQAIEYGQGVLDLIRPILKEVKQKYPNGVQKPVFEHLKQSHPNLAERSGTITIPTIISLSIAEGNWDTRPLEQAINELRRWK